MLELSCGTPGYMAPEIYYEEPYGRNCDVWSIGILFYELLFGTIPGQEEDEEVRYESIKRGLKFPSSPRISDKTRKFLINCLIVD